MLLRAIVVAVFALWFLATVLTQFSYPWAERLKAFDSCHIFPRWTFFAPNPGTSDFHLVFRQKNPLGEISDFLEVPLHIRGRWAFIWNPDKRVKKGLFDLAVTVGRLCATGECDERNITFSFAYIALLNYLTYSQLAPDTDAIQFALLSSGGFISAFEPSLVMCSGFHDA